MGGSWNNQPVGKSLYREETTEISGVKLVSKALRPSSPGRHAGHLTLPAKVSGTCLENGQEGVN